MYSCSGYFVILIFVCGIMHLYLPPQVYIEWRMSQLRGSCRYRPQGRETTELCTWCCDRMLVSSNMALSTDP